MYFCELFDKIGRLVLSLQIPRQRLFQRNSFAQTAVRVVTVMHNNTHIVESVI